MKRICQTIPAMQEWERRNVFEPAQIEQGAALEESHKVAQSIQRAPIIFTPITDEESVAIKHLGEPTYPVASFHKRFARDIQGATELSDKQRILIWSMVWRYRRQINNASLVAVSKMNLAELQKTINA